MPDLKTLPENLRTLSLLELENFRDAADKKTKELIDVDAFSEKLDDLYSEDQDGYRRQVLGLATSDKDLSDPLRIAISSHANAMRIADPNQRNLVVLGLLENFSQNGENSFKFLGLMGQQSESFENDLRRLNIDRKILKKLPFDKEQSFILQEEAFKRSLTYKDRTHQAKSSLAILESLQEHPPKEEAVFVDVLGRIGEHLAENDDELLAAKADVRILQMAKNLAPENADKIRKAVSKRIQTYEYPEYRSAVSRAMGFARVEKGDKEFEYLFRSDTHSLDLERSGTNCVIRRNLDVGCQDRRTYIIDLRKDTHRVRECRDRLKNAQEDFTVLDLSVELPGELTEVEARRQIKTAIEEPKSAVRSMPSDLPAIIISPQSRIIAEQELSQDLSKLTGHKGEHYLQWPDADGNFLVGVGAGILTPRKLPDLVEPKARKVLEDRAILSGLTRKATSALSQDPQTADVAGQPPAAAGASAQRLETTDSQASVAVTTEDVEVQPSPLDPSPASSQELTRGQAPTTVRRVAILAGACVESVYRTAKVAVKETTKKVLSCGRRR